MLILSRKSGESVEIGPDIRISVISLEKGRVRLAIDAPQSFTILRSELRSAMDANQEAAMDGVSPLTLLDLLGGGPAAPDDGHE